ncbi:hypothetical protein BC830DRAFT_1144058, partial [Chytriomyces sp. MP71]
MSYGCAGAACTWPTGGCLQPGLRWFGCLALPPMELNPKLRVAAAYCLTSPPMPS